MFNEDLIPNLTKGYSEYLTEQNKDEITLITEIKKQLSAIQKEIDNICSVIAKTASDALVEKLNDLDNDKKELSEKLKKIESQCKVEELTEEKLLYSFRQAKEMLKSGKLSTVKVLIERYVQKVTINGENIDIEFNLDVDNRIIAYEQQKETSQTTEQDDSVTFFKLQHPMLAANGAGGGT